MYFPAHGMIMAAGKLLAGHPWWGIWASCGLMCAAICWMLQGWLPPAWAFLGGMLAVVRLALFSYWIDTYTGAGALAALGGALVLGAVPRIRRHFRTRDFFWLALGMAILATSRPYEGLLVCVPVLAALAWWWFKNSHPVPWILLLRTAPAALVLTATFAFMAYYDYRVFGSASTPPYKINRQTYAVAQHFLWQSPHPEPVYTHRIIRDFYAGPEQTSEMRWYRDETRSVPGLLDASSTKVLAAWAFYLNFLLILPLVMLPWAVRDRRIGLLTVTGIVRRRWARDRDLLCAALSCARHGAPIRSSAPVHASSSGAGTIRIIPCASHAGPLPCSCHPSCLRPATPYRHWPWTLDYLLMVWRGADWTRARSDFVGTGELARSSACDCCLRTSSHAERLGLQRCGY